MGVSAFFSKTKRTDLTPLPLSELGVETVALRLETRMAEAGKWRAAELAGAPGREAPPELSPLTPELASYDLLLESEAADVH